MATKLAIAFVASLVLVADQPPAVVKQWEMPLPDAVDATVTAIEKVLGSKPGIKIDVADQAAQGAAPDYKASITLTDGVFSLPVEGVALPLPAEVANTAKYVEGVTNTKPALTLVGSIVEVAAA